MYTITFLKVQAFQLSKRHISTIHNLELSTPFPQSTSFSIVQTSYLNIPQFRVMYNRIPQRRAFRLSKRTQQSTIKSYVHHGMAQSTSFSVVSNIYLNNPQFSM